MIKQKLCALIDRLERCVEQIESESTVSRSKQLGDIETIIQIVANYYEITPRLLRGKCRQQAHCWPRHVAAYFVRCHSRLALQTIASQLGYSDHGSVLHAVRRVKSAIEINDRSARQDVEELSSLIQSRLHERIQQSRNLVPQFSEETAQTS